MTTSGTSPTIDADVFTLPATQKQAATIYVSHSRTVSCLLCVHLLHRRSPDLPTNQDACLIDWASLLSQISQPIRMCVSGPAHSPEKSSAYQICNSAIHPKETEKFFPAIWSGSTLEPVIQTNHQVKCSDLDPIPGILKLH